MKIYESNGLVWEYDVLDSKKKTVEIKGLQNCGETVEIPSSINGYRVDSIGADAFFNKKQLKSVIIPDSVTIIFDNAFRESGLEAVEIPASVETIWDFAFEGCKSLKTIYIGRNVDKWPGNPDDIHVTSFRRAVFANCSNLETVVVGDHLFRNFKVDLFAGCDKFSKFTSFPDGKYIKVSNNLLVYINCKSIEYAPHTLTSVTIPSDVESIEPGAFFRCEKLVKFKVEKYNNCFTAKDGILYDKSGKTLVRCPVGLESVVIPDGVTKIGAYAFYGCKKLESITIPSSVSKIEKYAFSCCRRLSNIIIPNNMIKISKTAFNKCDSLNQSDKIDNNSEE